MNLLPAPACVYSRIECEGVGIYEAVEKYCPRHDLRRASKPDGSWLPRVGERFPGAVSFWKPEGLRKYTESGLRAWHESVVPTTELRVANAKELDPLYEDEFQVIGNLKELLPWEMGALVDEVLVKSLLQEQFPQFAADQCLPVFLKDGWDSSAFRLGKDHVFRFPKRATAAAQLQQECNVLSLVSAKVPFATPIHQYLGRPSFDFPLPFSGYKYLSGTSQKDLQTDLNQDGIDSFARLLNALYAVDRRDLPGIAVETATLDHAFVNRDWGYFKRLQELEAVLDKRDLVKTREVCATLIAKTHGIQIPQVLAHNDLLPEHILLDPDAMVVTGIIDWGDVAWTHAAADLGGLAYSFGLSVIHTLLPKLSIFHALPRGIMDAIRLRALGCCISDSWYAVRRGDLTYLKFARPRLEQLLTGIDLA